MNISKVDLTKGIDDMSVIYKYLITFFVGMVPIIELRGAIPIGVGLGLSYFEAFICSFLGNIVPIYFIVKFIRPLFDFFGNYACRIT